MLLSRLLDQDHVDWAVNRLNEISIGLRRSLIADGNPYYRRDFGKALLTADYLYDMYTKVAQRNQAIAKAVKREQIKSAPIVVEKSKSPAYSYQF